MPVKHPQFVKGEVYHIVIRGIAGQKTFLEEKDYLRYLFSLYKFNNRNVVVHTLNNREVIPIKIWNGFPRILITTEEKKQGDLLIEILAFCLMPNHIHLLVRQLTDSGISLFLQKMGGYPTYFNRKYHRFGSLFQRPFKAIHIKTESQLLIVVTYIHLNPIDLIEYGWKDNGIADSQKVMEFLESFPWSSYFHYLKRSDLSWLVKSDFLEKIFKKPEDFRNFVQARISNKTELRKFLAESQKFSLE